MGCGARDRRGETPAGGAVPALDQVRVEREQLFGRLSRRALHGAPLSLREQLGEEGVLLVLHDVRLVDRDGRADPDVLVGAHDRVDRLGGRHRHVVGVVVHRGDAAPEHLHRADQGADVGEPALVARGGERRHLVEHEELERQPGQHALHEVAGRVEVRIDQARHREQAVGLDHAVGRTRPFAARVGTDRLDLTGLDHDVGTRPFAVGVVEREHAGVADDERAGHVGQRSKRRPHRRPGRGSTPHSFSAFQTGSTVES